MGDRANGRNGSKSSLTTVEERAVTHGELRGVVALDGPSGTGKSTVARRLASALGACYLDTGAMYRAATLAALRAGVDLADPAAIARQVGTIELAMGTDPLTPSVRLDGAEVDRDIRGPEVTGSVSAIAAVPEVRSVLIAEQRRIIARVTDGGGGIVVEGRDIGTVVAPDAGLKVYLDASPEARARRRSRQDTAAGRQSTVESTRVAVDRRDRLDDRTTPLRAADNAVTLDTTDLDVNGVLAELLSMVDDRAMRPVPSEQTAEPTAGRCVR
jgi:cytidylate kinase